jgi:hypothetical protein
MLQIARDISEPSGLSRAAAKRTAAGASGGRQALQSISTRLISESTPESLYAQIVGAAIELMASDAASLQMLGRPRG